MELLIDFTMHLVCWKANHWIRVRLATLFRYGIGPAKTASLDDIQVLHSSQNFLVVNKRYDVLINCDNPNVQVHSNSLEVILIVYSIIESLNYLGDGGKSTQKEVSRLSKSKAFSQFPFRSPPGLPHKWCTLYCTS